MRQRCGLIWSTCFGHLFSLSIPISRLPLVDEKIIKVNKMQDKKRIKLKFTLHNSAISKHRNKQTLKDKSHPFKLHPVITLWSPVAICLPVKHRDTWGPVATFLPHFYYTYNSPKVSTHFEWQLMLGGPVVNTLRHMASDWQPLESNLPQTPKQYIFSHLSLTHQ